MIKFIKELIADEAMWGWLMVFAGAPLLFFGMIFETTFDWAIYASYVGGTLAVVGFVWGALKG
jgi:hypothetical protein|tara:strand:+ start:239 stop:427 length:189 start_codon:yes stop_codon:yes gene_type:complete